MVFCLFKKIIKNKLYFTCMLVICYLYLYHKQIIMTIKNVTIGDKFINTTDRKSKRVSTVIDFIETKSVLTGDTLKYEVLCEKDYMG